MAFSFVRTLHRLRHDENAAIVISIMPKSNIAYAIDLRALRLLVAMVDAGGLSRAGEQIGMSQPAASRCLARLRRAVGDPLLVRTAGGYVPTPRALSAAADARLALEAASRALAPADFSPNGAEAEVTVATTDYGAAVVLSHLSALLMTEAPGLRLRAVPWSSATFDELERGGTDLALYADGDLPGDYLCRELFEEHYVAAVREGHPLLSVDRFENEICAWPCVATTYPEGRIAVVDNPLDHDGRARHPSIALPYFLAAATVVAATDAVAILPSRLIALSGARVVGLPLPAAGRFGYRLVWHRRVHSDPMSRWLRDAIARCCG